MGRRKRIHNAANPGKGAASKKAKSSKKPEELSEENVKALNERPSVSKTNEVERTTNFKGSTDNKAEKINGAEEIAKSDKVKEKVNIVETFPPKQPSYRNSNSGTWVVSNVIPNEDDNEFSEIIDDLEDSKAENTEGLELFVEPENGTGDIKELGVVEDTIDKTENVKGLESFEEAEFPADTSRNVPVSEESSKRKRDKNNLSWVEILTSDGKRRRLKILADMNTICLSPESILVLLRMQDVLTIHGKAEVQSIWGNVNSLGHTLAHETPYQIYSPDITALTTIFVISTVELSIDLLVQKFPNLQPNHLTRSFQGLGSSLAGFVMSYLPCKTSKFITKIAPFQNIYNRRIPDLGFRWIPQLDSFLSIGPTPVGIQFDGEDFYAVDQFISLLKNGPSPVVLLCGGQNAGKSTLGRFLINCSLQKCKEIAHLECDIGQTEFTPPGCVSLTLISQPLFGPAFCHQKKPIRSSFVGLVTPSDDTEHYLKCLLYVYEAYKNLPGNKPPLVVNTMGWVSGLGPNLLAETIRMVKPNLVIQLQITNRKMPIVDGYFAASMPSLLNPSGSQTEVYRHRNHKLIQINIQPRQKSMYRPSEIRALSLLSYLSAISPKQDSNESEVRPFYNWTPYRRSWNSLALHVCHFKVPNSQIMYALNGSMVALCVADKEQMLVPRDDYLPRFFLKPPVCSCLGFGYVRAIDPVGKLFHILTPMTPDDLVKVNCLLKGLVDLPLSMVFKQPGMATNAFPPYVEYETSKLGAQPIKERKYVFRK